MPPGRHSCRWGRVRRWPNGHDYMPMPPSARLAVASVRGRGGLLDGLADVQQHRLARRVAGLAGAGKAEAVLLGHPRRAAEEDLPLGFVVGDEHAVQADVGDDHAVWEVLHVE